MTQAPNSWTLSRSPMPALQGSPTRSKSSSSPLPGRNKMCDIVHAAAAATTAFFFFLKASSKVIGRGVLSTHGCSRGKLLHEYPSGSLHMDSRRDPAVLLLIKTVVITFSILLERGLCGATAWHAENTSSRLTGSAPAIKGCREPSPLCAEGSPQAGVELEKGVGVPGAV